MKLKEMGRAAHAVKFGAALAVGGLVLAGCAATPAPTEPETPAEIVGGYDPQPLTERTTITVNTAARVESFSALYLAYAMGEFEKENLDIEFTAVATQDALVGLGQNQVHVLGSPPSAAVFNAINSGVDIKPAVPCYTDNADTWWVQKDLADAGAASLKGKKVGNATGPSGTSVIGIDVYLQSGGLDITDVTIERFAAADVPTAVIQNAIDAAFIPEPGARVVDQSGVAVPVDSMPRDAGSSQCVYLFGPDLLNERPEVGAAFTRAIARTMRDYLQGDYKSNPQVVADLAEALQRTEEEIKATPSVKFDLASGFDHALYTRVQELWIEIGGILSYDTPMDPSDVIAAEFVDALNK